MTIARIDAWVFRAPIDRPVRAAVGTLRDRPALFIRLTDDDGATGWGEVFCNFPQVGAEHRARLIDSVVGPLLVGRPAADPPLLHAGLAATLRRLAIQCGEPGPFAQILGAIDQAAWDLLARRRRLPLWRVLGGASASRSVRVYASGLGPQGVAELAGAKREQGFRAFKLKVGFDPGIDLANARQLRGAIGDDALLMLDANQAWDAAQAVDRLRELSAFAPVWAEEPVAADEPLDAWTRVAREGGVPLAAGENMLGEAAFAASLANGHLRYIQPDVGKWGGLSGSLRIARLAAAHGATLCPHWLGGGIGLAASMHLRAALGDGGFVEVDSNPNPLREGVFGPMPLREGRYELSEAGGLGIEPGLAALSAFLVRH